MSLNVEAMRELIDDLRNQSGTYEQATGALRKGDNGFCCLGRACEIAVRHDVIPPPRQGLTPYDHTSWFYGPDGDVNSSLMPTAVWKWFGFEDSCPSFGSTVFSIANDHGTSHSRIADVFEAMLEADQAATLPEAHSRKGD